MGIHVGSFNNSSSFSCEFFVIGLTFILKIVYSYAIHILEFLL